MRIRKYIIGIVLLALAGAAAFCVKELIDVRHPEYAVARLTVTADTAEVPVTIAGFDWDFALGGEAHRPAPDVGEIYPAPASLLGGETLSLLFSQPTLAVEVKRTESYSYSFYDINGDLAVPYDKGGYLYEVSAEYRQGKVLYYFYIVVE